MTDLSRVKPGWVRRTAIVLAAYSVLAAIAFLLSVQSHETVLVPAVSYGLVLSAAGGAAAFLVVLVLLGKRWLRWLWLAPVPLLLLPLAVGVYLVPVGMVVASATLNDGRVVHLNIEPYPTDRVYALWTDHGLTWKRIDTELEYSEDGRFVGDERLALSRDGRRLFIGRGGIWTDCLAITVGFAPCDLGLERTFWIDENFEATMRENSAKMASSINAP